MRTRRPLQLILASRYKIQIEHPAASELVVSVNINKQMKMRQCGIVSSFGD